jgi:hypothetical protein
MTRRIRSLVVCATILALPIAAISTAAVGASEQRGTTFSWVGTGDGSTWTDPTNWIPQQVPSDGDIVNVSAEGATCDTDIQGAPDRISLSRLALNQADGCEAEIQGGAITITKSLLWGSGELAASVTLGSGSRTVLVDTRDREIQALTVAGVLRLDQATFTIDDPNGVNVVQGGHLRGSGTITGSILNSAGAVSPGTATPDGPNLIVTGDYTQLPGGTVQFRLEGAFDALAVGESASIKGRVVYRNTSSFSQPPYGARQLLILSQALTWSPSCRTTTGPFHHDGHWFAVHGFDAEQHVWFVKVKFKQGATRAC